jgi:hypothetical protein
MQRREFVTARGEAAAAPMVARARQAMPAIELFNTASPNGCAAASLTFRTNSNDHPRAANDAPRQPRVLP